MSLTAICWLLLWLCLTTVGLVRPVFAAIAYLLVFYTNPSAWWFGSGLLTGITSRWTLLSTSILVLSLLINGRFSLRPEERGLRTFVIGSLFLLANVCVVHYNFAANPLLSEKVFNEYWRGIMGAILLVLALRDRQELNLFLIGVVACTFLASFEIIVGGQGGMERGRLEGFSFPGANGSNGGSVGLVFALPLIGYFLLSSRNLFVTLGGLASAVFTVETLFRCNSRGAYVGLIAAGSTVLALSRGKVRRKAMILVAFGSLGVLAIAKDAKIWDRFYSIFAEEEERDASAESRLFFWKAGIAMVVDYPFGSGGKGAFYSSRGMSYISSQYSDFRSVHNGPLDMAAAWGIQGISVFMMLYLLSMFRVYRKMQYLTEAGLVRESFMGVCILGSLAGTFIGVFFTSVLDGEWFMWLIGAGLVYADLTFEADPEESALVDALESEDVEEVTDDLYTEEENQVFSRI